MSAGPVIVNVIGGGPFLTSNSMPRDIYETNRRKQAWRAAGRAAHLAVLLRHPELKMQRAHLIVVVIRATRTHSDADNVQPSAKAARDGATDAGMVPDDCDCHIASTTYERITIAGHRPALRMIWTPALEETAA